MKTPPISRSLKFHHDGFSLNQTAPATYVAARTIMGGSWETTISVYNQGDIDFLQGSSRRGYLTAPQGWQAMRIYWSDNAALVIQPYTGVLDLM